MAGWVQQHADILLRLVVRELGTAYQRTLDAGVDASSRTAVSELEDFRSHLDT